MPIFSRQGVRGESLARATTIGRKQRRRVLKFEPLEDRRLLTNDSFDLIGKTAYFNNPAFAPFDGTGVAIAILDTGADLDHPDFGPSTGGVANRIKYQADHINADSNASDDHGWGTHTASIIAKLAPGADLIILKVLNSDGALPPPSQGFNPLQVIVGGALDWVIANRPTYNIVGVVMPFAYGNDQGLPIAHTDLQAQLQVLQSLSVPVIAAAGNGFKAVGETQGVGYPASDPDVIAVGATWDADEDEGAPWEMVIGISTAIDYHTAPDRITSFSQRHEYMLDIVAPGARITAGWLNAQSMAVHGTRQAAAHVAAAVALAQDQHLASHTDRLNQSDVVGLLQSTGVSVVDNDPGEAIQDPYDNVTNTGLTFKRIDLVGMAYKLFKPAALNLKNTSDWGFSETDNKTYDTTPTLTGTVPKDAYVWIYNNTTVIDQFQVAAGSSTFERTLPSPLATGTYNLSIKVAENSTVTEPNRSQASNVLQVVIAASDAVTLGTSQSYAGRLSETLVVSGGNSEASSTLTINWGVLVSEPPRMLTKTGTGTTTIGIDATYNDRTQSVIYNSDAGVTQFTANVGQPPVGAQAHLANWSVYARKPGASASTIEFHSNQNLALLNIAAGAKAVVPVNGNRVISTFSLVIATGGTLDMNDNDMIIRASAATKDAVHQQMENWIISGRNGQDPNFVTNWNGTGIISSEARSRNVGSGMDLVNLGVIRNSDMDIRTGVPGSAWTTWGGQTVGFDDVLLKFTYTGDGDLDGDIDFEDYAAMDSAFFALIQNMGWATGDVDMDGDIDFDDYSIVDQAFFFQGNPL
jgi:hypothetical protein